MINISENPASTGSQEGREGQGQRGRVGKEGWEGRGEDAQGRIVSETVRHTSA